MSPPAFALEAEQWHQLFEAVTDAVMILDGNHRVVEANQATEALLGLPREQILGRKCYELVHHSAKPRPGCVVSAAKASGRREQGEFWVEHLGRHLRSTAYPLFDAEGRLSHVVHLLRDITALKEAAGRVSHYQSLLKAVGDVNQLIVREKDPETLLQTACERLFQARGYHGLWIGVLEEAGQRLRAWGRAGVAATGEPWEFSLAEPTANFTCVRTALAERRPFLIKDVGESDPCALCTQRGEVPHLGTLAVPLLYHDQPYGVLVVYSKRAWAFGDDETKLIEEVAADLALGLHTAGEERKRKAAEETLRLSEEKYRRIFENSPIGIIHYDGQGTITACNEKLIEILGSTKERLIGFNMAASLKDERMRAALLASLSGKPGYFEGDYLSVTGGKEATVKVVFSPVLAEEGTVLGGVCIAEDITARKAAEAKMNQQREELQTILDTVPAMVFFKDKHDKFLRVNDVLARAFQMSKREVIGKTAAELSPGKDYWEDDKRVMETGVPLRNIIEPMETPEGTQWVQTDKIPYRDSKGEIIGIIGFALDITERKRAEDALKESEQRYSDVVNHLDEVLFQTDAEGRWTFLNPAWTKIMGYEVEESLGEVFLNYVYPDDRARNVELFRPLVEGKKDFCRHEIRYQTKDHHIRWIEVFARISHDNDKQITGTIGTLTDITERKQAVEALAESEARFRALFETSPDGVVIDQGGKLLYANPALQQILKIEMLEERLGKRFTDFIAPEDRELFRAYSAAREAGAEAPTSYEVTGVRADGSRFPLEITAARFDYRGQPATMGLLRDITSRMQAQAALQESEERYRGLVEHSPEGIVVQQAGNIVFANRAMANLLRADSPNELEGKPFIELVHPESKTVVQEPLKHLAAGAARLQRFEERMNRFDGETVEVEVAVMPITYRGHPAVQVICHDITERKTLQQRLLLTERLAAIGQVAAGVAHEVNTPLANISLITDNLLETTADKATATAARQVLEQVDFAAHIVKDLLNFARPSTPSMEDLDLHHLLESALVQLEVPAWLKMDRHLAPDLPPIKGDRVHLQEVFTNLIGNAFDAMTAQRKGTLTLKTRRLDSQVEVTLRDSGPGIPAENLDHIFEPFFTTKPTGQGTGLGLPLVQRFVHDHAGTITVKSRPGLGTSVTVTLPLDFTSLSESQVV